MLVGVVQDRDDDLIEQRLASLDDVEMPVCRRIERAWKYCTTHIRLSDVGYANLLNADWAD